MVKFHLGMVGKKSARKLYVQCLLILLLLYHYIYSGGHFGEWGILISTMLCAVLFSFKRADKWLHRLHEDRKSFVLTALLALAACAIPVKPADEYQFRVFTTPVGPYFKGGAKPLTIKVSDFDRAAPHGTGHIKAGLNYAMSLHAIVTAHAEGYAENMYLDPATRTKVEETGGANFLFVTKDGKVVTPKSDSILPSITRRSLVHVAKEYLGLEVEEREVLFDEVKDFAECGLCGTAAVISPVGKIVDHGKEICLPSGMDEMGPVTKKLYETLTGIQMGRIEAPKGWIYTVD